MYPDWLVLFLANGQYAWNGIYTNTERGTHGGGYIRNRIHTQRETLAREGIYTEEITDGSEHIRRRPRGGGYIWKTRRGHEWKDTEVDTHHRWGRTHIERDIQNTF